MAVDTTPIPRKKKRKATSASKMDSKDQVGGRDKRKGRKKGRPSEEDADEDSHESGEAIVSRAKKSGDSRNGSRREIKRDDDAASTDNLGSNDTDKDLDAIYLNPPALKKEREALDDNFNASRDHFQKRGPWRFPSPLNDNKFRDVAIATLNKMGR